MTHQETLENKDKESQRLLKEKADTIFDLNKKAQGLEQTVYTLKEKVKHYEVFYAEKLGTEEQIVKEKENLVLQKVEEITQLQLTLMNKNEQIVQKDQDIKIKLGEIIHMKD